MSQSPGQQPVATPAAERSAAGRPRAETVRFPGADDFNRNAWSVLGLPVDMVDLAQAAAVIEAAVRDRRRLNLVTPNLNWLMRALTDREARRQLLDADLCLADGAPVVLLARLLGAPLRARAAGSDLFEWLRVRPAIEGRRIRVFFFGGAEGQAEAAAAALAAERGGLEPAGFLNPGYGDIASMSTDAVIEAINAADPDFVVVSLGAAKGQAWIDRNKDRLSAPVLSHLGAVVGFTGGMVRRAPKWIARAGFEWAWRIWQEPALLRRYASDAALFAGLAPARVLAARANAGRALNRAAEVEVQTAPGGATVRLAGDLRAGGLEPVRAAFREAAASSAGRVTLDLSSAGALDGAFLGLVLILEKHLTRRGARLCVHGLSAAHQALFKASAMQYPVEESEKTVAEGATVRARVC